MGLKELEEWGTQMDLKMTKIKRYANWVLVLLSVALGIAMLGVLFGCMQEAEAGIVGPRVPFYTFLEVCDLTADGWYSLVDLDDNANFPHFLTNNIVLKQLHYTGVLSETGHWDLRFGVVITVEDTGSGIEWFHTSHRVRNTQFDTGITLPEHGLNLYVNETTEKLGFVATTEYTSTAAITTTTALESPVTETDVITTYVEVGDIIMFVEEAAGTGDPGIDLSIGVAYDTD